MPVLYEDSSGSKIGACTAMCKPASCYKGNCGGANQTTTNLTGLPGSGHRCEPSDILYATGFTTATPGPSGVNGTGCTFNWSFEIDGMGMFYPSPFDNNLGWCEQHDQYVYDSHVDGMITALDEAIPKCDTITSPGYGTGSADGSGNCTAANGCRGAASFGCVSTDVAGPMPAFQAQHPALLSHPQPLYGVRTAQ